jgi:collagenase-like PrtC family protease
MELVLASNFDDALVDGLGDLPVTTLFGNFPVGLTGGGRPPRILPDIDPDRFRDHVAAVHRAGRKFYATLNSSDLALREYSCGFGRAFLGEVDDLLDLGVDGFVVALPLLLEMIHSAHPEVPITVSTFARVRTVTQGEYYLRMGADTIVLEEANRDFALLRGLVGRGARVEVLVNQTCLQGCPFRAHHLNTSSLASQPEYPCPTLEYPIAECGWEMLRDPSRLVSSIFVRPEDLEVYEEAGVHRFKVSGRNRSTAWLLRAARAYARRSYPGDLLDILSLVQLKAPLGFLRAAANREGPLPEELVALRSAFAGLEKVTIDNSAFPAGFLRRIAATDCEHASCSECGYCGSVARKVMRVDGRLLSEYVPPADSRLPSTFLPQIGCAPLAGRGHAPPPGRSA